MEVNALWPLFLAHSFRFTLGALLLYAAWAKGSDAAAFRNNLEQSFGFAAPLAAVITPGLIVLEAGLGLLLLCWPAQAWWCMLAAGLMLGLFTLFLNWRWAQESALKCGCFGEAGRSLSIWDLLRNYALLLGCAAYLWLAPALPQWSGAIWFAAAGLASLLLVLALQLHDIVRVLRASARGEAW